MHTHTPAMSCTHTAGDGGEAAGACVTHPPTHLPTHFGHVEGRSRLPAGRRSHSWGTGIQAVKKPHTVACVTCSNNRYTAHRDPPCIAATKAAAVSVPCLATTSRVCAPPPQHTHPSAVGCMYGGKGGGMRATTACMHTPLAAPAFLPAACSCQCRTRTGTTARYRPASASSQCAAAASKHEQPSSTDTERQRRRQRRRRREWRQQTC
jgi:hypothetical protein